MPCNYLKKLCKSGCDNYVCRAFFPERQPVIEKEDLPLCQSDDYQKCPKWGDGNTFRADREEKRLGNHCFFASNRICGKPKDWWCKGGDAPHQLYPVYDEEGKLVFTEEQLRETCWSGDQTIYEGCPDYILGMRHREEDAKLRKLNEAKTD